MHSRCRGAVPTALDFHEVTGPQYRGNCLGLSSWSFPPKVIDVIDVIGTLASYL
jgi:hypothetical protein